MKLTKNTSRKSIAIFGLGVRQQGSRETYRAIRERMDRLAGRVAKPCTMDKPDCLASSAARLYLSDTHPTKNPGNAVADNLVVSLRVMDRTTFTGE